ncbi:hypothetical protein [Oscillibacter sp.]|uniref:hypothetical protein n=1 Tax=Oscillibacter sp. TaxID=1945593 RepID=UPI002896D304|nr:hypothetical protein [Oscillibacter sp.]
MNRYLLAGLALSLMVLSGCGAAVSKESASGPEPVPQIQATSTPEAENSFTAWLPEGVEPVMAETAPLPELAKVIVDQYEIPPEEWDKTKYYYNYVDLNGDGTDEIFAVVMGPYTSGSGGDSALWVIPYAGMAVGQTFTLVRTPIIISDTMTNGAHEILMQRSGGGAETEYIRLVCSDGIYSNPSDAEVVADISQITGKAIISNDLIADMESGTFLTLADAKEVTDS